MLEASVTGLLRTVFIILGVFTLLRFLGRLIVAKREQEKIKALNNKEKEIREAQAKAKKNVGNVSIHSGSNRSDDRNTVDVDFEET